MNKLRILLRNQSTVAKWAYGVMALTLIASFVRGLEKWLRDKPEWFYYRKFVELPLVEAVGPDKAIFGYLPGCKALLSPFVLTEPLGYIIFALLNVAACLGILILVHKNYTRPHQPPISLLWLALCTAVPIWFSLQNNQLMAPALFLTLCAFSRLRKGQNIQMGVFMAFAVLLKTLPLAVMMFPLALRRWKAILATGLILGFLSLGLATLTDGFNDSFWMHLSWPNQVSEQNPFNGLDEGSSPKSLGINQSPAAEMVRLIQWSGIYELKYLYWMLVGVSLVGMLALSILPMDSDDIYWSRIGGWLAWVSFSAPFGRYYYLLFLVPAIYQLGLRVMDKSPRWRYLSLTILTILSFSLLGARGGSLFYAFAVGITIYAYLIVEITIYIRQRRSNFRRSAHTD